MPNRGLIVVDWMGKKWDVVFELKASYSCDAKCMPTIVGNSFVAN